jgi:predicted RNA-binding Zn-ribbon protein involved in translation (DUF1610 family)
MNSPNQNNDDLAVDEVTSEAICPKCLAAIRLIRTVFDAAKGRDVRMFECDDCGQRIWED